MEYLNQKIDISQDENGWIASWRYEAGVIEIGFFVTHYEAQDAIINLIRRDAAVRALLNIVKEWQDIYLIDENESQFIQGELMEYVFDQEES